ncbi:MAG: hypothetical protein Q8O53_03905 [Candidatus Moranbacteria bacterium]|nr:hypothetical protein [Candidatus Moranbacteria bacterium]
MKELLTSGQMNAAERSLDRLFSGHVKSVAVNQGEQDLIAISDGETKDQQAVASVLKKIEFIPRRLEIVDALAVGADSFENAILISNQGKDFTHKRRIGNFTYTFLFERDDKKGMYQVTFTTEEARYALVNQGLAEFRKIMDTVVEMLEKIKENDKSFEGIKFSGMKDSTTLEERDRLLSEKEEIIQFLMATFEKTPEQYEGFSFYDGYGNSLNYESGQLIRTYENKEKNGLKNSIRGFLQKFFSREKDTRSFPLDRDVLRSMTTRESITLLRYLGYMEKEKKDTEIVGTQRKNAYVWYLKKRLPDSRVIQNEKSGEVFLYV